MWCCYTCNPSTWQEGAVPAVQGHPSLFSDLSLILIFICMHVHLNAVAHKVQKRTVECPANIGSYELPDVVGAGT